MKKKLLVCVSLVNEPSEDFVESLKRLKDSDKYNVIIHVYDYRIIQSEQVKIDFAKVKQISFEKRPDIHTEISSSLFSTGATAFLCLQQNVKLSDNYLDICGIEYLSDENRGSVYSDFYVESKGKSVGFVHKSMPIASNLLPVIIMSRDIFLKNIDSGREAISAAINSSLSKHIPKKTFTVNIDG